MAFNPYKEGRKHGRDVNQPRRVYASEYNQRVYDASFDAARKVAVAEEERREARRHGEVELPVWFEEAATLSQEVWDALVARRGVVA